ncbi:putative acetyltransferase [Streptococcus suis]|nr:putative acetyltransferase [Streptococcus suis]
MSLIIRREEERDYRQVEVPTREAFWNVFRPSVYLLLHR